MNGIGYVCQYHNCAVPEHEACEKCMAERELLPPIESMTQAERITEFEMWLNRNQLTVDWAIFKERLDALIGRDLFTHELATNNLRNLMAEIRGQKNALQFLDELIKSLPEHLKDNVIPFDMSDDNNREFSEN